jgi:hypothetical protein
VDLVRGELGELFGAPRAAVLTNRALEPYLPERYRHIGAVSTYWSPVRFMRGLNIGAYAGAAVLARHEDFCAFVKENRLTRRKRPFAPPPPGRIAVGVDAESAIRIRA